jgi:hypothetical protein
MLRSMLYQKGEKLSGLESQLVVKLKRQIEDLHELIAERENEITQLSRDTTFTKR